MAKLVLVGGGSASGKTFIINKKVITEKEKTGNAIGLGLGIVFLLASRDILDIGLILQLLLA